MRRLGLIPAVGAGQAISTGVVGIAVTEVVPEPVRFQELDEAGKAGEGEKVSERTIVQHFPLPVGVRIISFPVPKLAGLRYTKSIRASSHGPALRFCSCGTIASLAATQSRRLPR